MKKEPMTQIKNMIMIVSFNPCSNGMKKELQETIIGEVPA